MPLIGYHFELDWIQLVYSSYHSYIHRDVYIKTYTATYTSNHSYIHSDVYRYVYTGPENTHHVL